MAEQEKELRAISREWMAARIVVITGFIVALGVGGYFAYAARQIVMANRHRVLASVQAEQAQENAQEASDVAGEQLCKTALANAKNFGIIPAYGQLIAYTPKKSDVTGRYVCAAATTATKYVIAADLVCRKMDNAQCVDLFRITQDDGTVLYQRHS